MSSTFQVCEGMRVFGQGFSARFPGQGAPGIGGAPRGAE